MSAMPWESGVEAELDAVEAPEKYRAALRSFVNAVRAEVALQRRLDAVNADNARLREQLMLTEGERLHQRQVSDALIAQREEIRAVTERYHGFANSSLRRQILEILGPKGE